jgi:hypothetical protein
MLSLPHTIPCRSSIGCKQKQSNCVRKTTRPHTHAQCSWLHSYHALRTAIGYIGLTNTRIHTHKHTRIQHLSQHTSTAYFHSTHHSLHHNIHPQHTSHNVNHAPHITQQHSTCHRTLCKTLHVDQSIVDIGVCTPSSILPDFLHLNRSGLVN